MKFEYLAEMRRFLQWRRGDAVLLGEANVLPEESCQYFGLHNDGIQMMFNFYVNQRMFYALATGDTEPLIEALRATREPPPGAQWAQFLRNHDELDLGRLINLLVEEQIQTDREARHHLKLEAYGYRWYRVGGLDHIIRREKA